MSFAHPTASYPSIPPFPASALDYLPKDELKFPALPSVRSAFPIHPTLCADLLAHAIIFPGIRWLPSYRSRLCSLRLGRLLRAVRDGRGGTSTHGVEDGQACSQERGKHVRYISSVSESIAYLLEVDTGVL